MIIPVLDLKNGIAVSGKSGKRDTYKPLKTIFHESSDPVAIATGIKDAGFKCLYVADLDAIDEMGSNCKLVSKMNGIISVMLDSGIKDVEDIHGVMNAADKIIIATETLKTLDDLDQIFMEFSKQNIVLSIDIKDDKLFSKHLTATFEDIIKKINELKPSQVILLDISRVGTGRGVDSELIKQFNNIETSLIVAGGIVDEDIIEMNKLGVHNFLVGTALHEGSFNF